MKYFALKRRYLALHVGLISAILFFILGGLSSGLGKPPMAAAQGTPEAVSGTDSRLRLASNPWLDLKIQCRNA